MEIKDLVKRGKINAMHGFILKQTMLANDVVYIRKNYEDQTVNEYIKNKTKSSEDRIKSGLRFVNLEEKICEQSIITLSSSEKIKVELVIALIDNREQIVLYHFDTYFMEKELAFFKKLFQKLVIKYNKTIVLIESKLSFLLDLADYFIVLEDNKLLKFHKDEFYSDELEQVLDVPPMVSFVKYVNQTKKKIGEFTDIKELIKAIYREV